MKVVQVSKPGGDFEIVERPIPEPGRAQVLIKVEACDVCHSDAIVKGFGNRFAGYPDDESLENLRAYRPFPWSFS